MVNIDSNLRDFILKKFPDRTVRGKHHAHSWQSSRWLYVTTVLTTEEKIHYEKKSTATSGTNYMRRHGKTKGCVGSHIKAKAYVHARLSFLLTDGENL